jgi:hypothetical protein
VALERFDAAAELFPEIQSEVSESVAQEFLCRRAIAYLRFGETQNCCARNNADSCLLPIRGEGIHTKPEGSKRAIELFTELLNQSDRQSIIHFRALWLLNIAYMTIGQYPDSVPQEYLIPPQAFESEEPFPKFPNVAKQVGIDQFNLAGGVIADDFDNDDYLDLVVSNWELGGQLRVYRNNRDGTFTDRTEQSGLMGITGGLNLVQADYDNDGGLDFLIFRGAWLGKGGHHPLSLLHNNGDGTFTDVTFAAGLAEKMFPTQAGGWADYDNDGDLDLFVGGEFDADWKDEGPKTSFAPSCLYRNNGDGTFTDVAQQAGVTNDRFAKGASWGDYDADGYADLYVSNLNQPNRLYHNNGDGTFTDVAEELGVTAPSRSFPCWFWDVDNDGALDIFVSAYRANPEHLAASYLGFGVRLEMACLYRGDGHGGFTNVAEQYNLVRPTGPMGANFGDVDNDGYPDFYLGTGTPDYVALMPNVLYHNQRGQRFADVTTAANVGSLQKGHGVALADFDNDGDLDIFNETGGALPGDKFYNALYENPGFGNHWLTVKLIGKNSNRSAIGARLHAQFTAGDQERHVYKHVNSGGSFGANPLRQTLGLASATKIDRLEVYWPTTGKTEVLTDVPVDRSIELVEGTGKFRPLKLKSFRLGEPAER